MASAIAFLKWENYVDGLPGCGLFGSQPLRYTSSQERLHSLKPGDSLWLVSRCPTDQQYYFTACLKITDLEINSPDSRLDVEFGRFSVIANSESSHDLAKRLPAEGLLRALEFESKKPIKFGASLGQSIQAIRFITGLDEMVLKAALLRASKSDDPVVDAPFGLWTKCDSSFASYFLTNWEAMRKPLAFLLYDSPPALLPGAPIFIHSDKNMRLLARFRESQYVSGYKNTVEASERSFERDRIWSTYRNGTIDPPARKDFDEFWDRQNGIRSLFIMDNIIGIDRPCQFKTYGTALEWGYPIGVGYRYLRLSQCLLLLRHANISQEVGEQYLNPVLA